MKSILVFLLLSTYAFAQTVTGKLVDENGDGIMAVNLILYSSSRTYTSTSTTDGTFSFDNITGIICEHLPIGYSISNNFPNPFNPKTRILITLPKASTVKVNIYNLLGEDVNRGIKGYFDGGNHYFDMEFNGLPNGVYFARISIDDKFSLVRKMMLLYDSQHLIANDIYSSYVNSNLSKTQEIIFDSLVAENLIIGSKTFTNLASLSEGTVDLGDLVIERYCEDARTVEYEGKTYHTVKIGGQCWLKENLDVGTMVESTTGGYQQTDNGIIEKYCYDNDPANCDIYGGLYEWTEAMQYVGANGAQGICPYGWHIPTKEEFEELETIVGSEATKLIDKNARTNYSYTNESGFSALFAGNRNYGSGDFNDFDSRVYFWSSTRWEGDISYYLELKNNSNKIFIFSTYMSFGYCVRCIKD